MNNFQEPIFITGCARSGTSLIGSIIHSCGCFGGDMSGPTKYNKKGMFENIKIRNVMVKPLLINMGCDPLGQYPLPNPNILLLDTYVAYDWKYKMLEILVLEGLKQNMRWFYKGAKLALIWPLWKKAFPDGKYLIVRRSDKDIIQSCLKTGFMRNFDNAEGWQWWIDRYKECFQSMLENFNCREIWPSKIINNNYEELISILDWLELDYDIKKIKECPDVSLWHYRAGEING